jgi:elongation factor 1 alpha-like protein
MPALHCIEHRVLTLQVADFHAVLQTRQDHGHFSFADFFRDMPWLNVPRHREAEFIEPLYPRGGLLGGASTSGGKMSKLQALAAARKKKAEEQKSDKAVNDAAEQTSKLSFASGPGPESKKENIKPSVARAGGKTSSSGTMETQRIQRQGQSSESSPMIHDLPKFDPTKPGPTTSQKTEPQLEPVAPSAFAQALLGPETSSSSSSPKNFYQFPYMSFTPSITDAFSGPSPDDVVLTAQSKGSLPARKGNA